jgi:putative membrane protein
MRRFHDFHDDHDHHHHKMMPLVFAFFVFLIVLAALFAALPLARAADADATQNFIEKATIGNQFEIESSQLALERSKDEKVRTFAQQMIDDHRKAASDLRSAVERSDTKPADASLLMSNLDNKHQGMLDKLKAIADDKAFDRRYISMQKDAHDDAVKLFEHYTKKGTNPTLQTFASQALPTLEEHREHVKAMK